ncbi:MAG TPA: twin-arginine translocation signal domain-containing protein, partial [Xanthomonadales bacterium]|nr:twin-arginine translocation signal domain-containing protein [Xanthomonadales bacterium]
MNKSDSVTRLFDGALSRRDFLKSSGLALGGLTIAVSFPLGKLAAAGQAGFAPNAWLHIADNGDTTLWCGRCEMGQ